MVTDINEIIEFLATHVRDLPWRLGHDKAPLLRFDENRRISIHQYTAGRAMNFVCSVYELCIDGQHVSVADEYHERLREIFDGATDVVERDVLKSLKNMVECSTVPRNSSDALNELI